MSLPEQKFVLYNFAPVPILAAVHKLENQQDQKSEEGHNVVYVMMAADLYASSWPVLFICGENCQCQITPEYKLSMHRKYSLSIEGSLIDFILQFAFFFRFGSS